MKYSGACKLCGSVGKIYPLETYNNEVLYTLYKCSVCDAQFWMPFKNPGSEWYEHDYRYKAANERPTIETTWSQNKILHFVKPLVGKLFDIGCGTGNFLNLARKMGWDVYGIDFDSNAIYAAQEWFGLPNIELKTLQEYVEESGNNNFDLITFFDVFEHIDNHEIFINQVRSLLKVGGYAAMTMPYRDGSRFLQPNDLPPRHLTRWNEYSLSYFFKNKGFEVVYMKRIPASFFEIVMKLRFKYGRLISFGLLRKIQNKDLNHTKELRIEKNKKIFSKKIKTIHFIAKLKDVFIFGLPASILMVYLLTTGKIYTGLFAIVRKSSE